MSDTYPNAVLCVDTSVLRQVPDKVQRDIDLEDILNNHTKLFTREEKIVEPYLPLDFAISVRSVYDNTVVQSDAGNKVLYYTNMTCIGDLPHKGLDLIMYLSSLGVLHLLDYTAECGEIMMKHSQHQPIGLYNPNPRYFHPIIYSHVILSDEGMKLLTPHFKKHCSVVPISGIVPLGNIKALTDTLIIVDKEEDQ